MRVASDGVRVEYVADMFPVVNVQCLIFCEVRAVRTSELKEKYRVWLVVRECSTVILFKMDISLEIGNFIFLCKEIINYL